MGTFSKQDDSNWEKKLALRSRKVVKYQEELDTRVNFPALQKAIDAIDEAMLGYQGDAKKELDKVRALNTRARCKYEKCVGLIFEWAVSASNKFEIVLPVIGDKDLSKDDRDILYTIVSESVKDGVHIIAASLELLKEVLLNASKLSDLFKSIEHKVHDDIRSGYYGKQKEELENKIHETHRGRTALIFAGIGGIFTALGAIIFEPTGAAIGLPAGVAVAYGVETLVEWNERKDPKKQLKGIQCCFEIITKKIKDAQEVLRDIIGALEEDRSNVLVLKGTCGSADQNMTVLKMQFMDALDRFVEKCEQFWKQYEAYAKWHGYAAGK
ncbi:uncharacterized protein Dana_GF19543 [Drosophila ananassae]|uniref:Uncharacterized protein n=1 Tax=Drosophila ananassae TaxID=7217 RepID=B3MXZ0_DROAN|nr:uncharacterized protein LOC6502299 [Drosophila ananassae]EDV38605.1 uncharacterized protein Dana_GF19543 [Drosophila ananassae]